MNRRAALQAITATAALSHFAWATTAEGQKLATAARAQVGVTLSYDPRWTQIAYPNGDVPRSTGVCADVVIRAARDSLGLDLQKLVHEDMVKHFDAYPAHRVWGSKQADTNIDHRRVLNLETYFQRCRACVWVATSPTPGDAFPKPLAPGDIVTWLLDARLPHIGIVVSAPVTAPSLNGGCHVVHNIGRGAEESVLYEFHPDRAIAHYRWPVGA
jgi:uncharacterized protein YijF (DUF1287 family)